ADAVETRLGTPPHLLVMQLTQAVLDALQGAVQLVRRRSPNDSSQFVGSHADSSTSPKARTGKVPRFLTLTGTAKKRKSDSASWLKPRRSSTIGTSPPSRTESPV